MPRRIYTYPADAGWNLYNMMGTIGVFIMAASVAIFAYNIIRSFQNGKKAGNDPWDASTLEWMTTSPPQVYNFGFTPTVLSNRPLWDHKFSKGMEIVPPKDVEHIHMPSPSWWPIYCTIAVSFILIGFLVSNVAGWVGFPMAIFGGLATIFSLWKWIMEPV
jgi:heme/copper-type cytochrome/quinol oxidase subunit 1